MSDASLRVIDWIEKQKGEKLSEEEKEIVREKCEKEKSRMPSIKSLEKFGIEFKRFE